MIASLSLVFLCWACTCSYDDNIFMIGCSLNILINFVKKKNRLSGTFHMKMLEIWQKNQLW